MGSIEKTLGPISRGPNQRTRLTFSTMSVKKDRTGIWEEAEERLLGIGEGGGGEHDDARWAHAKADVWEANRSMAGWVGVCRECRLMLKCCMVIMRYIIISFSTYICVRGDRYLPLK